MNLDDTRQVLIVGGGGYLGNALVRHLLSMGTRVRVLDAFIFDQATALADVVEDARFSLQNGDLRNDEDVELALRDVTDVVLLAAVVGDPACKRYPELTHEVNELAARRLFEALDSKPVERFVFTSTCSNYGLRPTDELATEESSLAPVSLYAETKVSFEQYVLSRLGSISFSPTLLRIATAYGLSARMRFDLTVSEFTRTLASGRELVVYDADTWRPYCHVRDIALAIGTVLSAPREAVDGEIFNVGSEESNYTKRMLVDVIQEYMDGEGTVRYQEGGVDPRNYRVSFQKIAERLGFVAQMTVPATVRSLVDAVRAGVFDDVEDRPFFYANTRIPGLGRAGTPEAG